MNEDKLRYYIRKELNINEAAGDMTADDLGKIFDSFANVFNVTKTAIKSLISVLVLNMKLIFSIDPESRKKAKEQYQSRKAVIENEYEKLLNEAKNRFAEIQPLLFLAYPGAYLGYEIAKGGASEFSNIREFFQEVGIDITSMRIPTGLDSTEDDGNNLGMMQAFFGGGTANTEGALTKIYDQQKKLQASLEKIFGFANSKIDENILLEQKNEGLNSQIRIFFNNVIAKAEPESFGVDSKTRKSLINLKREQSEKFSKDLEAPFKFIEKLAIAKKIEDVKSSIELLKNTPFAFKGIEKLTPEYLDASAKKALDFAKKDNKLEELFKKIGVKIPEDEKSRIDIIKAYQLRILLGDSVLKVKNNLINQIESLRNSYLKEFEEDANIEIIKRIAPGSDLESIMEKGIQNIRNAGKR